MNKKIQAKDLINLGIYTAIYLVLLTAIAFTVFIPVFVLIFCTVCPVVCGIPFMLMITKTKKPWLVFIMGILCGIFMIITGMGYWSMIPGIVFGFLADLILQSGKFESTKKSIIAYGVFSMWLIGNFIPMMINRQEYFQILTDKYGQEYVDLASKLQPAWILVPLLIIFFVFGILGGLLGKKLLCKHFERAGIV